MFYYDWTYILMLPGLLLGLWAQSKVNSAYQKYSRVAASSGIPAAQAAQALLLRNGNSKVKVEKVAGQLTDHYDPRTETLRLSDGVYASPSLAALGIAAHEAGHAMQKHEDYAPMRLRNAIVPVVQLGSKLYMPLFFMGLIFSLQPLVNVGIIAFALTLIFSLITLPVEFDASRRGIRMLVEGGFITAREEPQVKEVLSGAAMTYVAAAISSALQLLRLILISRRRDD